MKTASVLLALLISASFAAAEGPPVDREKGTITVPHETMILSESQAEEVETLGTLTLDSVQWQALRAIGKECPKRFETVIPIDYNDCTCDIGPYVIAFSRTKVGVMHSILQEPIEDSLAYEISQNTDLALRVDRRGQFYYRGVLIPYQKLLDTVRATKPGSGEGVTKDKDEDPPYLMVEIPVGLKPDAAAIKTRLETLYAAAKKTGWNVPE